MSAVPEPLFSSTHVPELDGLRGLAIFGVFLAHMTTLVPPQPGAFYEQYRTFASLGGTGVSLFFVLSFAALYHMHTSRLRHRSGTAALSPTQSSSSSSASRDSSSSWSTQFIVFYLRRVFRILPLYYLVLIIRLLILYSASEKRSFADITTHVFMLHAYWHQYGNSIIGVEWSLCVECSFYFLAPALFIVLTDAWPRGKYLGIAMYAVTCVLSIVCARVWDMYEYSPIVHMRSFFCAAVFSLWKISVRVRSALALSLLIAFVMFSFSRSLAGAIHESRRPEVLFDVFYCCILFNMLDDEANPIRRWVQPICAHRFWTFIGKISYSIYLLHLLVIAPVNEYIHGHPDVLLANHRVLFWVMLVFLHVAIFAVVVGISYVSYRFLELPAIEWGKTVIAKFTASRRPEQQYAPSRTADVELDAAAPERRSARDSAQA
jgi:peptidoglycan/LPS O-acetylase OafA/YrhL